MRRLVAAAALPLVACTAQPAADLTVGRPKDAEPGELTVGSPFSPGSAVPDEPTPATTVIPSSTAPTTTTVAPFVMPEDELPSDPDGNDAYRERILSCIRSFEGDYATETGNGHSGAYQFQPGTWAYAASGAGYPQYASGPASAAPPHVQDQAAWWLYQREGFGPWPPAQRWCRA